jgi:hypothetical protein
MAKVHIYVREQVTTTNGGVKAIGASVEALREAIETAGGDFKGTVSLELDEDGEPVAEPVVAPVTPPEPAV